MRIRFRVSTWLLILVLIPTVPLLVFLVYSGIGYANERQLAVEKTLIGEAERLSGEIRDYIARSEGYVRTLAASQSAKTGDVRKLYDFSRRIQGDESGIVAISMVDRQERMLMSSAAPFGRLYPVGAVESIRNVFRTRRPDLSGVFLSPMTGRNIAALTVPVDVEDETKYALRAVLATDLISQRLTGTALPEGWVAAVLDADARVVARSQDPDLFIGKLATLAVREKLTQKSLGLFVAPTLDGGVVQTVLRPIGYGGWHIAVGVPLKALSAPLKNEIQKLLWLGGFVIALCVGAVIFLSRKVVKEMREVVQAINQAQDGLPVARVATGVLELDQMNAGILNVDRYKNELEKSVEARTQQLKEAHRRVADFSKELEQTVELERRRISREVHDQIGSVLTGIDLILASSSSGCFSVSQMKALQGAIDSGIETARRISSELRPPLLDDFGLASALEHLLQERLKGSGISCDVDLQDEELLSEQQTIGCYRIAQEACTNVIRHANATYFAIKGRRVEPLRYLITLSDNGVGLPGREPRKGAMGLEGMAERAKLLGGNLSINSSPDGLTVSVHLPIAHFESGELK